MGRHSARVSPVVVPGAAASLVARTAVLAASEASAAASAVAAPPPSGPAVGLVFADGQQVELEADDPRLATFAAAASALLDQRRD